MRTILINIALILVTNSVSAQEDSIIVIMNDTFPSFVKNGSRYYVKNNDTLPIIVETKPSFPGGEIALLNYQVDFFKNKPKNWGNLGRKYVSFTVDSVGELKNIKIHESNNSSLDSLLSEMIERMPKWIPGTRNGVPCTTEFIIPINFEE